MYFKVYKKEFPWSCHRIYWIFVSNQNRHTTLRTYHIPQLTHPSYHKRCGKNTQKTDLIITKNHPLKKIYFSSFFFWYLKGLASCQYESIAAITQERACSPVIRTPEHSCLWFIIRAYFRNVFQYFLHFSGKR